MDTTEKRKVVKPERKIEFIEVNHSKILNGYGKCRSCGCKGWKPNYPKNDYCKDCGHHWSQHE